jgi:hypothetical protein
MSVGIAAKWPGKPKKAQLGAGVTNKRGHFLRTFRALGIDTTIVLSSV